MLWLIFPHRLMMIVFHIMQFGAAFPRLMVIELLEALIVYGKGLQRVRFLESKLKLGTESSEKLRERLQYAEERDLFEGTSLICSHMSVSHLNKTIDDHSTGLKS